MILQAILNSNKALYIHEVFSNSRGEITVVIERNHPYRRERIFFAPKEPASGQASIKELIEVGACLTRQKAFDLCQTLACEYNSDYLDLVLMVNKIFGSALENLVDAIGVPDGILAVVKVKGQNLYQILFVATGCATDLLEANHFLLRELESDYPSALVEEEIFNDDLIGPMYEEAVRRHSQSRNHWMHVPTYRFCHGTLARKISENCLEKTELLASKSSDIDYRDGQGNTILHFAASFPYNPWACSVLMDAMASDTAINEMGEMPIHLAIQCSNAHGL